MDAEVNKEKLAFIIMQYAQTSRRPLTNNLINNCDIAVWSCLMKIASNCTLLNNRKSTPKKIALAAGLRLVPSESSHVLVSKMLFFKILSIWLVEKNNFDYFLLSRFQLQIPIEMELCWNFPLEDRFFEKSKNQLDP